MRFPTLFTIKKVENVQKIRATVPFLLLSKNVENFFDKLVVKSGDKW